MLDGDKATKHCAWGDSLRVYPEISVLDEGVVVDRNRITGGGITAGLDFALTPSAEVVGPPVAQARQLTAE